MAEKKKQRFSRLRHLAFTTKHVVKAAYEVNPKLFIAVMSVNVVWGLSSVPAFYLEKLIIDTLIENIGGDDLRNAFIKVMFIVLLYLSLQLLRNVLSHINRFLQNTSARSLDMELITRIGVKHSELDLKTIEDPEFKDKFDKIEKEISRRTWGLMISISNIPNYSVGFLSAVLVLSSIHPLVGLLVVVFSLPKFWANSKYIKNEYELNLAIAPKRRLWGWLNHYLMRNRNYMELKILELRGYLAKKMRGYADDIVGSFIKVRKKRYTLDTASDLPLLLYELAVSAYLIIQVLIGVVTVGTFQLYIRSLRLAQSSLSGLVQALLEIYESYFYINDLVWLMNLEPSTEVHDKKGVVVNDLTNIKFDSVHFRYKDDLPYVLRGVDFEIKKGEKIAIVGENGAGKTTLVKLIGRFYDPTHGDIMVTDNNLKDIDLTSWRRKMGILFQKFETYPFSVREAIGFGDIKRLKDKKAIRRAAKRAGIHDYIEGLPKGYDNPLSVYFDKGVDPSMGQWQRFGIARMLFRESADLIILDEPTSNVDPEAEEKIFKELRKITKNKMLIFVTQRFSTVKIADRIFVMHRGKMVEMGTHKELMKLDGKYARLFTLQAEAYLNQ